MLINRHFSVFRTAASGMESQRIALGAAAENIANATTSRTENGAPYRLKRPVHESPEKLGRSFRSVLGEMQSDVRRSDPRHLEGLSLDAPAADRDNLGPLTRLEEQDDVRLEFDPTHPHANAEGYVAYPDVNLVEEMSRMVSANRLYEANLSSVSAAKEMIKRTLEI